MTSLQNLEIFRHRSYLILGNGRDALFDLMDAVLTTRSIASFVELSLSSVFRREWPSIYEALQDGRPPRQALMKEYVKHIPRSEVVVLAADHTAWSRLYAKTLQERTYEHQPQVISGVKPITLGHGYSTIAWIPQAQGSWALPLLHERITSLDTPIGKAATQLRQVCAQISGKVLFLGDGEYGSAPFLKQTADIECNKLIGLRPNRVLYHAPKAYQGKGRRRKHGEKFSLKDRNTWTVAPEDIITQDDKLGRLRVRRWKALHLRQAAEHPFDKEGAWGNLPPGHFRLILVERLDAPESNPVWLIWMALEGMTLSQAWKQYLRRFAIEHWYRFMRQRLHWTVPQLSTPKQMETWSDLMPLMTWQLWLARDVVEDSPLPW
jgi:DDE superfamily endonuclease